MGSLMPGWGSRVMDENTARFRRNKSLTKEEINTFWRSKSQRNSDETDMTFPEFGSPANSPAFLSDTERRIAAVPFSRSQNDIWSTVHRQSAPVEETSRKPDMTGDWWTRSNWAFLNEPPRDEMYGTAHKYTAQFNVARLATGNA